MSTSIEYVKKHISDPDGNWGTMDFRTSALSEVVKNIHFCAHANRDNAGDDGQPPTNHWSSFLELSSGNSVRMDVAPGEPGKPGMVVLEMKAYSVSNQSVYLAKWSPEGVTVAMILELIIRKRRDCYIFADVGEGCRYWLRTLALDMAEVHILPMELANKIADDLAYYWKFPMGSGHELRAMTEGTFY